MANAISSVFVIGLVAVAATTTISRPRLVNAAESKAIPIEQAISARQVAAGTPIIRFIADYPCTLSGFYARLSNTIGPVKKPTTIGIRINGQLQDEQVQIPVYGRPLKKFTATGGKIAIPLDVAQEYHVALKTPYSLTAGQVITVEVLKSEPLRSGLTAGLQLQGVWQLAEMRAPFREVRGSGPISRAEWSTRQVIVTGNQSRLDPLCAPQNNSGIVSDSDGTLYQFTAFYSVDEQFGGGRTDSYSYLYSFRCKPGQKKWESLGMLVNPIPMGLTYAGDPFAFRDLEGRPCLVFTTCDGTHGFADWQHVGACFIRSQTNSFAGPWSKPWVLFEGLPGRKHNDRVNCLRIYPRLKQKDYLVVWIHGEADIAWEGLLVKDLTRKLSHKEVLHATQLARNQEEGGAGFVRGDKGYISTWQIPSINDPTGIQRLYEFDLDEPLNPERWRIVPGSVGWTDPRNPVEDGGPTADSWAVSYLSERDELWATMVVWSASKERNSVLACSTAWEHRQGSIFRFGVPARMWSSHYGNWQEVVPVVEYAVGRQCSLSAKLTGYGSNAYLCMGIAPSAQPLLHGAVCVEVTDQGSRLAFIDPNGFARGLTAFANIPFVSGQPYRIELVRDGWEFHAIVNEKSLGQIVINDPIIHAYIDDDPRFKFLGYKGGYYELTDAVLTDGTK